MHRKWLVFGYFGGHNSVGEAMLLGLLNACKSEVREKLVVVFSCELEPQRSPEKIFEDIARGLIYLANEPCLRSGFREAARPSILSFDWQRIVEEKLLPVYSELLE